MTQFADPIRTVTKLEQALATIIRGRGDTIRLVLTALVADGHVLLEDYPGSGKTTLARSLGGLIEGDPASDVPKHILPFRRIQFTPDMLPGDVLGVNVFEPQSGRFSFLHGPVFAHVVLADEINRTGPKVQSAFLECMAEKQVTIDNVTYPLDQLFFVLGTQNPLDIAGTYPLPLVQLDRFLLKVPMAYVDAKTEIEILEQHEQIQNSAAHLSPVCSRSELLAARDAARKVHVAPALREAMVELAQATRHHELLQHGASTRATLMLQAAVRAHALLSGREFATEDDLKTIAPFVLLHRLRFAGSTSDSKEAFEEMMRPVMEKLIRRGVK